MDGREVRFKKLTIFPRDMYNLFCLHNPHTNKCAQTMIQFWYCFLRNIRAVKGPTHFCGTCHICTFIATFIIETWRHWTVMHTSTAPCIVMHRYEYMSWVHIMGKYHAKDYYHQIDIITTWHPCIISYIHSSEYCIQSWMDICDQNRTKKPYSDIIIPQMIEV